MSQLVREAIEAKRRDMGGRYTLRELSAESNVDFSLLSKIARGERQATRQVVLSVARALEPHLKVDEALLAGGYAPSDRTSGVLRLLLRLPEERWAELEEWIGERLTYEQAGEESDPDQRQQQSGAGA